MAGSALSRYLVAVSSNKANTTSAEGKQQQQVARQHAPIDDDDETDSTTDECTSQQQQHVLSSSSPKSILHLNPLIARWQMEQNSNEMSIQEHHHALEREITTVEETNHSCCEDEITDMTTPDHDELLPQQLNCTYCGHVVALVDTVAPNRYSNNHPLQRQSSSKTTKVVLVPSQDRSSPVRSYSLSPTKSNATSQNTTVRSYFLSPTKSTTTKKNTAATKSNTTIDYQDIQHQPSLPSSLTTHSMAVVESSSPSLLLLKPLRTRNAIVTNSTKPSTSNVFHNTTTTRSTSVTTHAWRGQDTITNNIKPSRISTPSTASLTATTPSPPLTKSTDTDALIQKYCAPTIAQQTPSCKRWPFNMYTAPAGQTTANKLTTSAILSSTPLTTNTTATEALVDYAQHFVSIKDRKKQLWGKGESLRSWQQRGPQHAAPNVPPSLPLAEEASFVAQSKVDDERERRNVCSVNEQQQFSSNHSKQEQQLNNTVSKKITPTPKSYYARPSSPLQQQKMLSSPLQQQKLLSSPLQQQKLLSSPLQQQKLLSSPLQQQKLLEKLRHKQGDAEIRRNITASSFLQQREQLASTDLIRQKKMPAETKTSIADNAAVTPLVDSGMDKDRRRREQQQFLCSSINTTSIVTPDRKNKNADLNMSSYSCGLHLQEHDSNNDVAIVDERNDIPLQLHEQRSGQNSLKNDGRTVTPEKKSKNDHPLQQQLHQHLIWQTSSSPDKDSIIAVSPERKMNNDSKQQQRSPNNDTSTIALMPERKTKSDSNTPLRLRQRKMLEKLRRGSNNGSTSVVVPAAEERVNNIDSNADVVKQSSSSQHELLERQQVKQASSYRTSTTNSGLPSVKERIQAFHQRSNNSDGSKLLSSNSNGLSPPRLFDGSQQQQYHSSRNASADSSRLRLSQQTINSGRQICVSPLTSFDASSASFWKDETNYVEEEAFDASSASFWKDETNYLDEEDSSSDEEETVSTLTYPTFAGSIASSYQKSMRIETREAAFEHSDTPEQTEISGVLPSTKKKNTSLDCKITNTTVRNISSTTPDYVQRARAFQNNRQMSTTIDQKTLKRQETGPSKMWGLENSTRHKISKAHDNNTKNSELTKSISNKVPNGSPSVKNSSHRGPPYDEECMVEGDLRPEYLYKLGRTMEVAADFKKRYKVWERAKTGSPEIPFFMKNRMQTSSERGDSECRSSTAYISINATSHPVRTTHVTTATSQLPPRHPSLKSPTTMDRQKKASESFNNMRERFNQKHNKSSKLHSLRQRNSILAGEI